MPVAMAAASPPSRPPAASYRSAWPDKAPHGKAMTSPARVVQELFHTALLGEGLPYLFEDDPAHPPLTLLMDRNVAGQDDSLIATLIETGVLDDSISEIWTYRLETFSLDGKPQVEWQQRQVCRRSKRPPCI